MFIEQLELKRTELNILIESFCMSSKIVVEKAREFEELANKIYEIKDGAYWMKRAKSLEKLLRDVQAYCPVLQKHDIEEILKVKDI